MGGFGPQSETSYIITTSTWITGRLLLFGLDGGCLVGLLSDEYDVVTVYLLFKISMIVSLVWCLLSCVLMYTVKKVGGDDYRGRYFAFEFVIDIGLAACFLGGIGALSKPDKEETGTTVYALLISIGVIHALIAFAMLFRANAYGAFKDDMLVQCLTRRKRDEQIAQPEMMEQLSSNHDLETGLDLAPRYQPGEGTGVATHPSPIHQMFTSTAARRNSEPTINVVRPKHERKDEDEPPPPYVKDPDQSPEPGSSRFLND